MKNNTQSQRTLGKIIKGIATSDGEGVRLTRVIAGPELAMLDPFLLLDVFESDQPQDYIGGFPDHPHRGFETVTYMLAGKMRHRDSIGNEGVIGPHGVQWMTAGRGIIHSEMPEQEEGLLRGIQLWVNLPASHKMSQPGYQELSASELPLESREDGTEVRVIAGTTDQGTSGPIVGGRVNATYLHVSLPAGATFQQSLSNGQNAFLLVLQGDLRVAEDSRSLQVKELGVLEAGDLVTVKAGSADTEFLLVAGDPLNEPVARQGPFVMNTHQELEQAFADYRHGRLARSQSKQQC